MDGDEAMVPARKWLNGRAQMKGQKADAIRPDAYLQGPVNAPSSEDLPQRPHDVGVLRKPNSMRDGSHAASDQYLNSSFCLRPGKRFVRNRHRGFHLRYSPMLTGQNPARTRD